MFACTQCGAKYQNRENFCPICWETHTIIAFPNDDGKVFLQTRPRQIITAKDLISKHRRGKTINGFEYLGYLPNESWTLLVYGLPGQGKSVYSFQLAHALQETVLYFAVEECHKENIVSSQSIIKKLIDWEIRSDNLLISDAKDIREIRQDISEYDPSAIVIDSITALGCTLKHKKTIWVAQSTKDGHFRGSQEIAHDADITLKIEDRKAIVEKNRFGEIGIFPIGMDEILV